MSRSTTDPAGTIIEELVHTGLVVTDLLPSLLEGAYGTMALEDSETVIELLVSICRPALLSAPADDCLAAAALICAIRKQVLRNEGAPAPGEVTL